MRLARILICLALSSPLTYSTRQRWLRLPATCNSSVLLPMPGSPPSRMALPGDQTAAQHPVQLLVSRRGTGLLPVFHLTEGHDLAFAGRLILGGLFRRFAGSGRRVLRCSSKVFHSPQSGSSPASGRLHSRRTGRRKRFSPWPKRAPFLPPAGLRAGLIITESMFPRHGYLWGILSQAPKNVRHLSQGNIPD